MSDLSYIIEPALWLIVNWRVGLSLVISFVVGGYILSALGWLNLGSVFNLFLLGVWIGLLWESRRKSKSSEERKDEPNGISPFILYPALAFVAFFFGLVEAAAFDSLTSGAFALFGWSILVALLCRLSFGWKPTRRRLAFHAAALFAGFAIIVLLAYFGFVGRV